MRFYLSLLLSMAVAFVAVASPAQAQAQGAAWVPSISNPPQGWTSVDLFTGGTGYVHRTDQSGAYFWKTTDGGVTYRPADVPPGHLLDFATAEIGYAAAPEGLWRTADGAGSWRPANLPTPREGRVDHLAALYGGGDGSLVAVGLDSEEPHEECASNPLSRDVEAAVSSDGGATWERVALLAESGQVQKIEMLDEDFGVAIVTTYEWTQNGRCGFTGTGTLGQLVYVIERDSQGTLQGRQVLDCRPRICGSVGIAAKSAFTVGFADGGLAHTSDGGKAFTQNKLGDAVADAASTAGLSNVFWVTEIEFANADVGYAVTNGRGMWRTADGGATWTAEPSTRGVYDLGIADLGVADANHALAGGPTIVMRRAATP